MSGNNNIKPDQEDFYGWYFVNLAKVILIFSAFVLFLQRSWVGEDAFIFFKYVDNFVAGRGLVFNLGERVEGFTAPLWVFVLAFARWATGAELRPIAIVLGLVLSTVAVSLLLFGNNRGKYFFPLGFVLLITNSAFRDFATSGFETSLTYLLLVLALVSIIRDYHFTRPILTSIILSLLVLNRPESFLILLYVKFLVWAKAFEEKSLFKLVRFLIPPVLILGGYQIFRMGYYASLLPNTFYAKKGGSLYIEQGFNYLKDFAQSYPLLVAVFFVLLFLALANKQIFNKTKHILAIIVLLCGYVFYAGGDYMHGRSLLMALIASIVFIELTTAELLLKIRNKLNVKEFGYQIGLLLLLVVAFKLSLSQVSVTKKAGTQVNNIADERARFGYEFNPNNFKRYASVRITTELGWAERGFYYRELSQKLDVPISVVNPNIGYFGYASGDLVNVMGGVLIDPFMARRPIVDRGKIGHENDPQVKYVLTRRPTFAYTPFKYWNEHAHFKWDKAVFAYAIQGDSNDSYVPVFDLSNKEFLQRFSALIGKDVKIEIDDAQREYLVQFKAQTLNENNLEAQEYLAFLKEYWYPYASQRDQDLFDDIYEKLSASKYPVDFDDEIWFRVTGELDSKKFIQNIVYSITKL